MILYELFAVFFGFFYCQLCDLQFYCIWLDDLEIRLMVGWYNEN